MVHATPYRKWSLGPLETLLGFASVSIALLNLNRVQFNGAMRQDVLGIGGMTNDGKGSDQPSMTAAMSTMQAALGSPGAATQSAAQANKPDGKTTVGADIKRIIKEVSKEARKSRVPLYIAVLAACLALVSMAEGDVKERALGAQIEAANQFAFFQAKNIRRTDSEIAADVLDSLGKPELAKAWRDKAERYSGEKGAILKEARRQQDIRTQGLKQSSHFAIAIALLQIAIVLATAALILGGGFMLGASVFFALGALFFTFNGYYLYLDFPTDPIAFGQWLSAQVGELGWRQSAN